MDPTLESFAQHTLKMLAQSVLKDLVLIDLAQSALNKLALEDLEQHALNELALENP